MTVCHTLSQPNIVITDVALFLELHSWPTVVDEIGL